MVYFVRFFLSIIFESISEINVQNMEKTNGVHLMYNEK